RQGGAGRSNRPGRTTVGVPAFRSATAVARRRVRQPRAAVREATVVGRSHRGTVGGVGGSQPGADRRRRRPVGRPAGAVRTARAAPAARRAAGGGGRARRAGVRVVGAVTRRWVPCGPVDEVIAGTDDATTATRITLGPLTM